MWVAPSSTANGIFFFNAFTEYIMFKMVKFSDYFKCFSMKSSCFSRSESSICVRCLCLFSLCLFYFSFCSVSKLCVSVRRTVEIPREAKMNLFFSLHLSSKTHNSHSAGVAATSCEPERWLFWHISVLARVSSVGFKKKTLAHKNPRSNSWFKFCPSTRGSGDNVTRLSWPRARRSCTLWIKDFIEASGLGGNRRQSLSARRGCDWLKRK